MKSLKIKFPKTLSIHDKAKLLIRDIQIQNDSEGKERLLSPFEEQEIKKHAQNQNQIQELNRLGRMFNQSISYIRFMNIDYLIFLNNYKDLTSYLSACAMSLMYQVKLNVFSFKNEIIQSLIADIETNEFLDIFSLVEFTEEGSFANPIAQSKFLTCIERLKDYERMVFKIDVLSEKIGFPIESPRTKTLIIDQRSDMQEFIKHEGLLEILDKLLSARDDEDNKHNAFFHAFFHTKEACILSESEKESLRKEVENDLLSK
jgi:CRISPR/Cas system CSM-associated protein Csm2 small subunit